MKAQDGLGLRTAHDIINGIVNLGLEAQILVEPNNDGKDAKITLLWGVDAYSAAGEVGGCA